MVFHDARAKARRAASLAVCLFFGSLSLLNAAHAEEALCPPSVPSLVRAGNLAELSVQVESRQPVRIVAIGSSSTEGIGASAPARAYPAQLEVQLRNLWKLEGLRVDNLGRGGETADETLARLEAVLATKPALVIWQLGTNDALRGGDEEIFRAFVRRGISAARAEGVDLVLLDPQYFPGIGNIEHYERFVRVIRQVARDEGVSVFSRYTLMKNWNLHSPEELRSMLAGDAFHMSDRGYTCLTRSLGAALASLVPASRVTAQR